MDMVGRVDGCRRSVHVMLYSSNEHLFHPFHKLQIGEVQHPKDGLNTVVVITYPGVSGG